jgi:hypothetical protein
MHPRVFLARPVRTAAKEAARIVRYAQLVLTICLLVNLLSPPVSHAPLALSVLM